MLNTHLNLNRLSGHPTGKSGLKISYIIASLPILIYSVYWGWRSPSTGSDTMTYINIYRSYLASEKSIANSYDAGFLLIMQASSLISGDPKILFTVICLINGLSFYILGLRFLKDHRLVLIYVTLLLTSPFYLAININILRHGTAISVAVMLLALTYKFKNPLYRILLAYFPTLFHRIAGFLTFPLFVSITRVNMIYVWFFLVIVSYFSEYYANFLSSFIREDYIDYVSGNFEYIKGFRMDFTIFSALPVFMLLIIPYRKMSNKTRWVFNSYLTINGLGLAGNFISFSDRLLINSWILMPILTALYIKDINTTAYKKRNNRIFFTSVVFTLMLIINVINY